MKSCLLLACLLGCSPVWTHPKESGAQETVKVCINLPSQHEASEAARAIRTWDKSLEGWRHFVPEIEKNCSQEPNAWSIEETLYPPYIDSKALAFVTSLGQHHIRLVSGRYDGATYGIVLHETGHSLGAQHVDGALMSPSYNPLLMDCPDLMTVAQVAAYNHISLENLSWCFH